MTQENKAPQRNCQDENSDLKLLRYEQLLKKWQRSINLVADSTLDQCQTRHFKDSLQVLPMLPTQAKTLYDLGSGAGFPGLVLALKRPGLDVHLIESNHKKTSFLATVSRELDLPNVTIHTARIENLTESLPPPDVITARAFASMENIFRMTASWTQKNEDLRYILLKGRSAKEEICQAQRYFRFEHHSAPSQTDPEAAILRIQKVYKKTAEHVI